MTNTDVIVGVSDRACDELGVVFNSPEGLSHLTDLGIDPSVVSQLGHFGLSSICNVLAAIKTAKSLGLGSDDAIVTVATDGAELYASEREVMAVSRYVNGFSSEDASAAIEEHLQGADNNDVEVLDETGKNRIFNLGYYTWVEQQGIEFSDFEIRRDQHVWQHLQTLAPAWDELIQEFNDQTGVLAGR